MVNFFIMAYHSTANMMSCCHNIILSCDNFSIGNDITELDLTQFIDGLDRFTYIPQIPGDDLPVQPPEDAATGHVMTASELVPDLYAIISSARPTGPTSKRGIRLNKIAVQVMTQWYQRHLNHPYPDNTIAAELARAGNISTGQVKKWFSNKRMRDCASKVHRTTSRLNSYERDYRLNESFRPCE